MSDKIATLRPTLSKSNTRERLEVQLRNFYTQKFLLLSSAKSLIKLFESLSIGMGEMEKAEMRDRVKSARKLLARLE